MITVLMAVYNGEKYLREQLDSILAQDSRELVAVVSDDGSADGSRDIIREYAKKEPNRIFPIFRERPSGSPEAHFLDLIAQGEGEYVMLSDQDDVWLPGKVSRLMKKMRSMEHRYGKETPILVQSDLKVTDENLHVIAESYFRYQKISPERNKLCQLLVQNNVTGGAVMMNRALLSLLRKKPQVCLMHDSWIALVAACFGKIGWVDEPLYLYRQHGANSLGAKAADTVQEAADRLKDGSRARENYRRMFGQAACLLKMYQDQLSREQIRTLKAFIRLPKQGRIPKICSMIKYGFTKNSVKRTIGQMLFMP